MYSLNVLHYGKNAFSKNTWILILTEISMLISRQLTRSLNKVTAHNTSDEFFPYPYWSNPRVGLFPPSSVETGNKVKDLT